MSSNRGRSAAAERVAVILGRASLRRVDGRHERFFAHIEDLLRVSLTVDFARARVDELHLIENEEQSAA